jgi:hypothetical protein
LAFKPALGAVVHGTGRLIQDQDRRVVEQGPGHGDVLPLASGKPSALFPDLQVKALGMFTDKVIDPGEFGGAEDKAVFHLRRAENDVSRMLPRNRVISWGT